MGNERGRNATFVHIVLKQPERRVRDIGPGFVIALVTERPAGIDIRAVTHFDLLTVLGPVGKKLGPSVFGHELGATAVIAEKKDQGVIEFFQSF